MAAEFFPTSIKPFQKKSEMDQAYSEKDFPRITFIPTINGAFPKCLVPRDCSPYIYMDFPSESNKNGFLQSLIDTHAFAPKRVSDLPSSGISLDQHYDNDVLGDRRIEPLVFTFAVNGNSQEVEPSTYITDFDTAQKAYEYTQRIWGRYIEVRDAYTSKGAAAAVHTSSSQPSHRSTASSWSSRPATALLPLQPQVSRTHIPAAAASASAVIARPSPSAHRQPAASAPARASLVDLVKAALPPRTTIEGRWADFLRQLDVGNNKLHVFMNIIDGACPLDLESSLRIYHVYLENPAMARQYHDLLTGGFSFHQQSPEALAQMVNKFPTYNNRVTNTGPVAFMFNGLEEHTAYTSNCTTPEEAYLLTSLLMAKHAHAVKELNLLQIITTAAKITNEDGPETLVWKNLRLFSVNTGTTERAIFLPPITPVHPATLSSPFKNLSDALSAAIISSGYVINPSTRAVSFALASSETASVAPQQPPSPAPNPLNSSPSVPTGNSSTASVTPQQSPSPTPTPLSHASAPTGTSTVSATPQQLPSPATTPLSPPSAPTGASTVSVTPQQPPSPAPTPLSHTPAPTGASTASAEPHHTPSPAAAPSRSYSSALTGSRNAAAAAPQSSNQGPKGTKKRPNQRTRRRQQQAQRKPDKS